MLFRWTGAAIAAAVMALPLMVRAMRLSIEAVDRRLEEAARTLGAAPWRAFRTITLPLSAAGRAGRRWCSASRARSASSARRSPSSRTCRARPQTLPLAIYAALQLPGGEAMVWRLAAISVALSLAALVASELLARRGGRGVHVL